MQQKCVWYVSKYANPPTPTEYGGRAFHIMRELTRQGVHTVIVTSNSNRLGAMPELAEPFTDTTIDGVGFMWIRTLQYESARSLLRILSWLHFEWMLLRMPLSRLPRPDAIIVSSLSLLTVLNGVRLKRHFRCRLVFEIRDIWPLTLSEEGGFSSRNPLVVLMGWIERFGYKRADAIVGTMPNLGEHVSSVLNRPTEVYCVPMGVAQTDMERTPVMPSRLDGVLPLGRVVVGYAGTIGATNALEVFFETIEAMKDAPEAHFLVVGGGDKLSEFKERFGSLMNLTFLPRVPRAEVPGVLARCDILYFSVFDSRVWDYGQSLNKLIDYMLAGKPIVASYSGFQSMVNEAQCGQFVGAGDAVALRDAIQHFVSMSPGERNTIGARGREWLLSNRSFSKLASDYREILFPIG